MKYRRSFLALFIVVAGLVLIIRHHRGAERSSGPLPASVYVWQRDWTAAVDAAVKTNGPAFAQIVFLGAEVSFKPDLRIARVSPDFSALRQTAMPAGVALRIGPYHGQFESNDGVARRLCDLARNVIDECEANGLHIAEFQIDFDCPEARLDGYRLWVRAMKQRLGPMPVVITALPSWLKRASFTSLAHEAGAYVLQVHSLQKPSSIDAPMTLCDPAAALLAVEQAGRLGVPFRVALPTYSYMVAFDTDGKFVGIGAEAASAASAPELQMRELRADPIAMAALVRGWTQDRPSCLNGLIWYRMPTGDDALNWRWPTLQAVMAGHEPTAQVVTEVRRAESGLFDVALINRGNADARLPARVNVEWRDAQLLAADGLGGFDHERWANRLLLSPSPSVASTSLAAGDRRAIGWLRLTEDKEVHADVSSIEK